ncbi:hypothetical protein DMENIID0001_050760 [Sergentomyia squamirostris]
MKTRIPRNFVQKTGVVYDVPLDILIDELKMAISSPLKVIDIVRIRKLTTSRQPKRVDGHHLHQNYFRRQRSAFGHVQSVCQKKLCRKCSLELLENHQCAETKCVNYGKRHDTRDKECPARNLEMAIQETVTIHRMTYAEGKDLHKSVSPQNLNGNFNSLQDYPALPERGGREARNDTATFNRRTVRKPVTRLQIPKFNPWWQLSQPGSEEPRQPIENNPFRATDLEKCIEFMRQMLSMMVSMGISPCLSLCITDAAILKHN